MFSAINIATTLLQSLLNTQRQSPQIPSCHLHFQIPYNPLNAALITFSVHSPVTVKILQALMSMNEQRLVGEVHDVRLTLYRDQNTVPQILWQEDQCFKLTFDTPYRKSDFWRPFSDKDGERPTCKVSSLWFRVMNREGWIFLNKFELGVYKF